MYTYLLLYLHIVKYSTIKCDVKYWKCTNKYNKFYHWKLHAVYTIHTSVLHKIGGEVISHRKDITICT